MEEKKQIKISLKTVVLLIFILLAVVAIIAILVRHYDKSNLKNKVLKSTNSGEYKEVSVDGKMYYQKLSESTWKGQYHQESFNTDGENENIMEVVPYSKYLETIDSINSIKTNKIKAYYTNKDYNYIILAYANGYSWCEMELIDCLTENNKIIIYGDEEENGVMAGGSGYFIAIPTNMAVGTEIEYRECYTSSEIDNLKEHDNSRFPDPVAYKPIIYLYPTEDTEISVELLKDENLTCSYPKYKDKWNVLAQPNGNLKDLTTDRQLYALYYESENSIDFKVENDGFVIKGEDTAEFLEEKLAILGLNERESEEFIIYWLPKLEANKYNYIRFATLDEINANMPLEINPSPDTIVRVLMTFKGLDNPIDVQEQQLKTPDRAGFVAVEWGGTEIK